MNKFQRKAYSYIRFSTPEQALGDSLRRQIAGAEAWCKQEGLNLDQSLRDEGVSGFRRRNATVGALSTFLKAINERLIESGSVLIVESLDRLSRAEPLDALDLLRDIIKAGVEVVTLQDRQRYTSASMREIGPLLQALVIMSRAHEESHVKSQRLAATWQNKRAEAGNGHGRPMTRQIPAWLRIDGAVAINGRNDWTNARFALIPERAKIVRRIFEMRAEGWGRMRIASDLNKRGVEPWGRGKRRSRGGWHPSYIKKILGSRAVIGEYQPHRLADGRGSKRVAVGEPLPNYFPAVITSELWYAAQAFNRSGGAANIGRPSTIPFSGLLFDPCDAPMHVVRHGRGWTYVTTAHAHRVKGREVYRWRLDHLEACVLMICRDIDWARVLNDESTEPELRRLKATLAEINDELVSINTKFERMAKALLDDLGGLGDMLKTQATALTTRRDELQESRQAVKRELGKLEQLSHANHPKAFQIEAEALKEPTTCERFRAELRMRVTKIVLYPDGDAPSFPVEAIRKAAIGLLGRNHGLIARRTGRVCGALQFYYANGKKLIVWVTYRPSARRDDAPVPLIADGVGYSVPEQAKLLAEIGL